MSEKEWSKWLSLHVTNFEGVPSSSGVYQLSWAIDRHTQPIHRLNGIDENGLLYIGKANDLKSRIRGFWRYITSEKGKHTAGFTYIFYMYDRKIKPEQLGVRWMLLPKDEIDARALKEFTQIRFKNTVRGQVGVLKNLFTPLKFRGSRSQRILPENLGDDE